MTSRTRATAIRGTVRELRWLGWAAGVLVVVLALVTAFGGFARATPTQGPEVAPGATVELSRFRVAVDRVELVDVDDYGYDADPSLKVWLRATTTGDRTADGLPYGMLVVVADGQRLPAGYAGRLDGRDPTLDPDLPRTLRYTVDWTGGGAPASVKVLLYDETSSQGFLDDSDSLDVDASHPAAVVALPVQDLRKHR